MTISRLITFQLLWFLNIKFSASYEILLLFISTAFVCIDKIIFYPKQSLKMFIIFFIFVLFSGILIDSILLNFNILYFLDWSKFYSPPFMWSLWLIFIPYYQIGFERFDNKIYTATVLAFIFAPFSYYSGSNIGNVSIDSSTSLIYIGALWAIFFPLSLKLRLKLKILFP